MMAKNFPSYYEKLARRKVLKCSLLGRLLLGIEGVKHRNRDALYLLTFPFNAVLIVEKRLRRLLSKSRRSFHISVFCLFFIVTSLVILPEVIWAKALRLIAAGISLYASLAPIFDDLSFFKERKGDLLKEDTLDKANLYGSSRAELYEASLTTANVMRSKFGIGKTLSMEEKQNLICQPDVGRSPPKLWVPGDDT